MRCGDRARRRAFANFTWDAKARQTLDVYRWVLGEAARRPDFGCLLPEADPLDVRAEPELAVGQR